MTPFAWETYDCSHLLQGFSGSTVAAFQEIISAIKSGAFDPDSTRSGRFSVKRIKIFAEPVDAKVAISSLSSSDTDNHVSTSLTACLPESTAVSCLNSIPDEMSSSS
jgi:hypothetical protein